MPQIIVKGILFRQIRHLIIPDAVIAQIQKQIAGCKCNGKNTGCLKSADSGNDNEQKNRLPGVQSASDCIPQEVAGILPLQTGIPGISGFCARRPTL